MKEFGLFLFLLATKLPVFTVFGSNGYKHHFNISHAHAIFLIVE